MKKPYALFLLLVPLISTSAFANPESWYFNFGLGYGSPSYPSAIQSSVDALKSSGASNAPMALDLGFYWPTSSSTVLGVSINGISDSYTFLTSQISVIQTGIFLSGMYFLGLEPGAGFYFRADLGAARAAVDTNFGISGGSNYGFGGGGGIGFGIPVSSETRILLQATYMYRHIESYDYGATAFTVSGLF